MNKNDNIYVFVYGSLKQGFENHGWLKSNEGKFIGEGVTNYPSFKLYSVNDFYPAIAKGNERISGELYKVDKDCLQELDYLEGYPHYYDRDKFSINCNGKNYEAYIYYINDIKETYKDDLPTESKRIKRENGIASWEK